MTAYIEVLTGTYRSQARQRIKAMDKALEALIVLIGRKGRDFAYLPTDPEWWELKMWLAQDKPWWAVPDYQIFGS